MSENNKKQETKRTIKKVIIIITIFTTYIMVFLIGRITNILTLGTKDEVKDDKPTQEPTIIPTYYPGGEEDNPTEVYPTPKVTSTPTINNTPSINPTTTPTTTPTSTPITNETPKVEQTTKPQTTPSPSEEIDGIITLWEGNKKWTQLQELNIFNSKFYNNKYENKIAPGFYGEYEFLLENNSSKSVSYILSFEEENPHNINVVYKLTNGGRYILGNNSQNVYINNIKLEEVTIPAKTKTLYKLIWKWEDTNYDTQIGKTDNTQYKLKIKVQAEETK